MFKKIFIGLIILFVVLQFIRPSRNISDAAAVNDISTAYNVPADVHETLKKACYDCHSNNTRYPWYTNIQPVGLWMQNHINEGKEEINFSEFATYKKKKQAHKMEEVVKMIEKNEMPLSSYTWIHKDAILTDAEKTAVINWAKALESQIRQQITE
ncbi:MAG: heme-binding domain-containing protein [Bacteroidetes bacterium]|nr:heme-binding domain-containing protein [Bacteroidota bacterium]